MDEKGIARKYLITSLTIKNLELDLRKIQNSTLKIKGPYIQLIEKMISKAINGRRKLKQEMFKRNIQVTYLYTQGDFVTYKYLLNGKVEEVPFYKYKLKKDVEEFLQNLHPIYYKSILENGIFYLIKR